VKILRSALAACCAVLVSTSPQAEAARAPAPPLVLRTPHEPPGIVRIDMPEHSVAVGQLVHAAVYATSNTASVEARIYSYGMPLQRAGVGYFRFAFRVPAVPFFFKRAWPVQVIARNVDGHSASKRVMIAVR
jgi:hypothetical protein